MGDFKISNVRDLARYIQLAFVETRQEAQGSTKIRFYLNDESLSGLNTVYFVAEVFNVNTSSGIIHTIKCYQNPIKYYEPHDRSSYYVINNACDYGEILSAITNYLTPIWCAEPSDLEKIYIDLDSISGLGKPAIAQQDSQDDSPEPVLVSCECCKFGHTRCENASCLFYRMPCEIVKGCEQGEKCGVDALKDTV